MAIEIRPHTLFFTIGPSNAGKSHYCETCLIPRIIFGNEPVNNRGNVHYVYISSDAIRRTLWNNHFNKYAPSMLVASKPAFDLLYQQLECSMQYPVSAEYIIVDTKGTSEKFRDKMYELAKTYHYDVVPIIFNYSKYEEYGLHGPINKTTNLDIKKTRLAIAGIRRKPNVKEVIQIKTNDFTKAPHLEFPLHELYRSCIVENDRELLVVSDIHGCYDEFIELLELNGFKVEDHKIIENRNFKRLVINGDYIDKGPKVEDMIDFLYENDTIVEVIIGNHENRLYKELTQGLAHIDAPYFDSFDKLDDDHKQKFIKIFERSKPFIKNDLFIITHAPCSLKMLGKVHNRAMEAQRYCKHEVDIDDKFSIYDELENMHVFDGDMSNTTHIFGHIPTSTPGKVIKGRMLIDGGCDDGGVLLGVSIKGDRTYTKSVLSHQPKVKDLPPFTKPIGVKDIDIDDLSYKEKKRIYGMARDKVNFISGTMSPCDKLDDKLESIESGIKFFLDAGVTDIVMEPKYMGSRCNMYLFETNEQSYAVTRNGYRAHNNGEKLNLDSIYDKMRERLRIDWNEVELVIIDGELMPWSVLGEGLIQEFCLVSDNIDAENKFLRENGFEEALAGFREAFSKTNFSKDIKNNSKADMIKIYGDANYKSYKAINGFEFIPIDEKDKLNSIYKKQMELYGSEGEIDYKPFAILKIVYKSGEEHIPYLDPKEYDNEYMFNLLNGDGCQRFHLEDDREIGRCKAQFYLYTTEEHYEGVVLKPTKLDERRTPPYIKVRNPDYLTIIYGCDYLSENKHEKLCRRKNVNSKIKASIREWKNGLDMLSIKYHDINTENTAIKQLYASFIAEENKEKTLDPRL